MVAPPTEDASALLTALRRGDEAVFMQVVAEWTPGMRRLARTHVATDASADEVVQEAWVSVLRGLDGFEGRSAPRTWRFGSWPTSRSPAGYARHGPCPSRD